MILVGGVIWWLLCLEALLRRAGPRQVCPLDKSRKGTRACGEKGARFSRLSLGGIVGLFRAGRRSLAAKPLRPPAGCSFRLAFAFGRTGGAESRLRPATALKAPPGVTPWGAHPIWPIGWVMAGGLGADPPPCLAADRLISRRERSFLSHAVFLPPFPLA